jgi:hypothetical protein
MKWVEDKFNKMWRELQEKGINHSGPELRKFLGVTDTSTIGDAPRFEEIYEKALGSRQYGDASTAEQDAFRQLMTQSVRKKVGYKKNKDNSFSLIVKPQITADNSSSLILKPPITAEPFRLPVYLDEQVQAYFAAKAEAKGVDLAELVNDMLKKDMELIELAR